MAFCHFIPNQIVINLISYHMKKRVKPALVGLIHQSKIIMFQGFVLLLIATNVACKKNAAAGPVDGYATGKVTDTKGNALAGIEVIVENTLLGNHTYASGVSDSKGNYKIKLPNVGTFHASAYVKKAYNGKTYELPLHPDKNESFSNEGAVVNFQWKLSGPMPTEMEGFYGGSAYIYNHPGRYILDEHNIEFTLKPVGNLIDGSAGQTIVRRSGEPQTVSYGRLMDIPIGRYTVTATYLTGGTKVPLTLRVLDATTAYASQMTLDFEPTSTSGKNTGNIQYYY
jgi:hypothetical protein